jgi:hypothetical protein
MKATRFTLLALLMAAKAFAAVEVETTAPRQEVLAAIFGPADSGSCTQQQTGVLFAATHSRTGPIGVNALCTATAQCSPGTVSCQGNNSPASCTAVDRNCPGEQGHVTCDGNTTWCPAPCPCTTGTLQQRECCQCDQTGDCFACCVCGGGSKAHCFDQCYR